MTAPLLSVRDLSVNFRTRSGMVHVLGNVSLDVAPGEIVGVVGESGSGKSVLAFTIMRILDRAARIASGSVHYAERDVLKMSEREVSQWRGAEASIVFQNPRTALNPIRTVGQQVADVIARHRPAGAAEIREQMLAALRRVRIPDPERRSQAYPYELSGGMCQRVGIAAAIACAPRLLIADEPTTGLDVTTQAVIMDMVRDLVVGQGMASVLITHDLALASQYCDRIVVMHAGHVVECAPVADIFARPRHPYTARLLSSIPSLVERIGDLRSIEGSLPDLRRTDLPPCRFAERCDRRIAACDAGALSFNIVAPGHHLACRNPL